LTFDQSLDALYFGMEGVFGILSCWAGVTTVLLTIQTHIGLTTCVHQFSGGGRHA
jgi:hypothetical protein